jgi:hypothetical protein
MGGLKTEFETKYEKKNQKGQLKLLYEDPVVTKLSIHTS